MVDGAVIRGVVGAIQWSYYKAAVVEGYTVIRQGPPKGPHTWSLRARVVLVDTFKMAQRPLIFVAPYDHGTWRWPIVQYDQVGDHFRAELGAPIEDGYVKVRAT